MKELSNCHDCGAEPGHPHTTPNCDVQRCSVCAGQYMVCGCKGHDKLWARWSGIWPGLAESKELGMDLNTFYIRGYNKVFFIKPKK